MKTRKRSSWFEILFVILIPVVGMAVGAIFTSLLQIDATRYSNLIVNLCLLAACMVLLRIFKLSPEELGLKIITESSHWHVILSLAIFSFYVLVYVFVVKISTLKPFSSQTLWSLLTYLIVVIAEELYFRGIAYGFVERRLSSRLALIITSLLFGLFHARQGFSGIISKTFTGWLWGSVRYSTGMIFLIIFPVHFAYNAIWLLFEGNWNHLPGWAIYALPTIEFVFGLAIVISKNMGLLLPKKNK